MAENFLVEQLRRIREMSEQMSRVRDNAAQISEEVARERASVRHDPLHAVRDLRVHSSIYAHAPASAEDHGARHASRSSRSRRK
jgi:hypothetical protein